MINKTWLNFICLDIFRSA